MGIFFYFGGPESVLQRGSIAPYIVYVYIANEVFEGFITAASKENPKSIVTVVMSKCLKKSTQEIIYAR